METTFKETKIGWIPEEWEAVELGNRKYSQLLTGGTPNTKIPEYWGGSILWMNSGDIHKKYITMVDGRITDEGMRNSAAKILPKNSVLVALNGQGRTKGTVAINRIELTCNQSIAAYVLNQVEFDPSYVLHYLSSKYRKLRTLAGDDDRAGLNLKLLRGIITPKPPLPEQRKIAEILSTVDEAIEKTDAIIQQTQQLKKGLMQKLFTEGIGHTRFKETKIGRIPEEWEIEQLGNTIKLSSGKSRPKDYKEYQDKYYIHPIYGGNGILGYSKEFNWQYNTIILGRVGEYCGAVHINEGRCWISDNALFVKQFTKNIFNIYFLALILSFHNLNKFKAESGQPLITQNTVYSQKVVLPPIDEQLIIVEILLAVDAKIKTEQTYKAELEQLKKGLMQVLLTGRVRVKV